MKLTGKVFFNRNQSIEFVAEHVEGLPAFSIQERGRLVFNSLDGCLWFGGLTQWICLCGGSGSSQNILSVPYDFNSFDYQTDQNTILWERSGIYQNAYAGQAQVLSIIVRLGSPINDGNIVFRPLKNGSPFVDNSMNVIFSAGETTKQLFTTLGNANFNVLPTDLIGIDIVGGTVTPLIIDVSATIFMFIPIAFDGSYSIHDNLELVYFDLSPSSSVVMIPSITPGNTYSLPSIGSFRSIHCRANNITGGNIVVRPKINNAFLASNGLDITLNDLVLHDEKNVNLGDVDYVFPAQSDFKLDVQASAYLNPALVNLSANVFLSYQG